MEEGWERPARVRLSVEQLTQLIQPAFPGRAIASFEIIPKGLANTNVRLVLDGGEDDLVLRLYTREPRAAARERGLMAYLESSPGPVVPVPALRYSRPTPSTLGYAYSIWDFVPGVLLQDAFRTLSPAELVQAAAACGRTLAGLAARPFDLCGEFDGALNIAEIYGAPSEFTRDFVEHALFEGRAGPRLGLELRDAVWQTVRRLAPALRDVDDAYSLVHGDYKRSNILLAKVGGVWSVAAVLDWEFCFAGPPLIDVGNFLRAGEALPPGFRDAFVGGYREAGAALPTDWLRLSRLLDLISQMTFLTGPEERPRVFRETIRVVRETLRVLA